MRRALLAILALVLLATSASAQLFGAQPMLPTNPYISLGTGVLTALGVNVGTAGSVVVNGGTANLVNLTINAEGIVADGFIATDGAMASGSTTLTSASRNCALSDVGKEAVVAGAGASSAQLKSTVASCSGNAFILADANASGGAVSAMQWAIGSDNSATLNALVVAHPNATILLPPGVILLDATSISLDQVAIIGQKVISNIASQAASIKNGTTFLLTSTSTVPFTIVRSPRIEGVNFIWPGQFGVTVTPQVFPPLFEDGGVRSVSNWYMVDVSIINAYDLFTQLTPTLPIDKINWRGVQAYCIHYCITMSHIGESWFISESDFNANNYPIACCGGNAYLLKYSEQNAEFMHSTGNGIAGSTCSTRLSGGLQISNTSMHDFNIVFNNVAAYFSENNMTTLDVGDVNQFLVADNASVVSNTEINGIIQTSGNLTAGSAPNVKAIDLQGTCTNGLGAVEITGGTWATPYGAFNVAGTNTKQFNVAGGAKINYGLTTGAAADASLATLNDVNLRFTLSGNSINSSHGSSFYSGVVVTNVLDASITGNTFSSPYYALDTSGIVAGRVAFTGNVVDGTTSTASTNVPTLAAAGYTISLSGNTLDKPQFWTVAGLGTCGAANAGAGPYLTNVAAAPVWNAAPVAGSAAWVQSFCQNSSWTAH